MQVEAIWFRGTYRYPSTAVLERALASARAWLDEEELYELDEGWMTRFEARGTTLRIDTQLPPDGDWFAAIAVVQTLALDATEGMVEVVSGQQRLDTYPCGSDE